MYHSIDISYDMFLVSYGQITKYIEYVCDECVGSKVLQLPYPFTQLLVL